VISRGFFCKKPALKRVTLLNPIVKYMNEITAECNEILSWLSLRSVSSQNGKEFQKIKEQKMQESKLQEECIRMIFKLTTNPGQAEEFAGLCGLPLLLKTMEQSKRNSCLQESAVYILVNSSNTCVEYVLSQQELETFWVQR